MCTCCYWCSLWVAESSWWHSTGTSCWEYENACIYSSRETGASAKSPRPDSADTPRERSLVVLTLYSFIHLLSLLSLEPCVLTTVIRSICVLNLHQVAESDSEHLAKNAGFALNRKLKGRKWHSSLLGLPVLWSQVHSGFRLPKDRNSSHSIPWPEYRFLNFPFYLHNL